MINSDSEKSRSIKTTNPCCIKRPRCLCSYYFSITSMAKHISLQVIMSYKKQEKISTSYVSNIFCIVLFHTLGDILYNFFLTLNFVLDLIDPKM